MAKELVLSGPEYHSEFKEEIEAFEKLKKESDEVSASLMMIFNGITGSPDFIAGLKRNPRGISLVTKIAEQISSNRQAAVAVVKGLHGVKRDVIERRMKAAVKEAELGAGGAGGSEVTYKLLEMLQEQLRRGIPGAAGPVAAGEVVDGEVIEESAPEEVDVDAMIQMQLGAGQADPPGPGNRISDPEGTVWVVGDDNIAEPTKETAKVHKDDDGNLYAVAADGARLEVYDVQC